MAGRNVPPELICEILSLLPVKPLIRFKLVCKKWLALLSNPNFISKNFHLTYQNPNNDSVVVHSISNAYEHMTTLFSDVSIETPITLKFPNPEEVPEIEFIGSINGIVCYCSVPLRDIMVLWNPATHYCKVIRYHTPQKMMLIVNQYYAGFGFDQLENDFGIIRIVCMNYSKNTRIEVYSVNKNSWKEIKVSFLFKLNTYYNTIVKGMLYFGAFVEEYGPVLLGFDFHNEVLHQFPMMDFDISEETVECLTNLNDVLGMIVYRPNIVFDIFEMNAEFGCWNKMYSVATLFIDVKRLLTCTKNGKIVFQDRAGNIFLFDLKTRRRKNLRVDGAMPRTHKAFSHTGSLIFVEGMDQFS